MVVAIGIDPGKQGGIAWLRGSSVLTAKMPETVADLVDVLRETYAEEKRFAIMEFVRSSPQMGVKSAFTFGQGFGRLETALYAAGIPFEITTPQKWQKTMSCMTGGDKNKSKQRASELFPGIKVTHANADALLLATYGRRSFPEGL